MIFRPDPNIHRKIAESFTSTSGCAFYCKACGKSEKVDPVACLQHGWPKCCGATMSLDKPKDR